MVVRFGIDVLLERFTQAGGPPPAWRRVGLVTNDAARLGADTMCRTRQGLLRAGVPLQRLFGPEHGLIATAVDGALVDDTIDTVTGLPVVSLYGTRMRPTVEELVDLDVLLFDILMSAPAVTPMPGPSSMPCRRARRRRCRCWCSIVPILWAAACMSPRDRYWRWHVVRSSVRTTSRCDTV